MQLTTAVCGVVPSVTPAQVRDEMSLVEALQYEVIFYARLGVDCYPMESSRALEAEIDAILGE